MECPRCGEKLYYGTRFCPSCGLVVEDLVKDLAEQGQESEDESGLEVNPSDRISPEESDSAKDDSSGRDPKDNAESGDGDEGLTELEESGEDRSQSVVAEADAPEDALEGASSQEDPSGKDGAVDSVESQEEGQEGKDALSESESVSDDEVTLAPSEDEAGDSAASKARDAGSAEDGHAAEVPVGSESAEQGVPGDVRPTTSISSFVREHKRLCIVVCAIAAILLMVVVALFVRGAGESRREQEEQAALEQALNTALPVAVTLDIEGYQEEHMTPIPLRVKGKAANGKEVDEVHLVTPNRASISMLPGSYGISLEGRPVSDEGVVFDGSVDTFTVEVAAPQQSTQDKEASQSEKGDGVASESPVFVFAPIAPENVRDVDVDALRSWMKTAGIGNAESYIDAVVNRRNEALERLEQEQAAREEEELKKVEDTTRQIQEQIKNGQKRQNSSSSSQTGNQQNGSSSGYGSGAQDSTGEDGYGWDGYDSYDYYYGQSDAWGY